MKKYFIVLLISFISQCLFAQHSYEELAACWRTNQRFQTIVQPQVESFQQLQKTIYHSVQALIRNESITQENGVPVFENLAAVTRAAQELAELDSVYETQFVNAVEVIAAQCVAGRICSSRLSEEVYREQLANYLEEEVFYLMDNYASDLFANSVGFRSALQQVNQQVNEWLSQDSEELAGEDPALNQPLTQDHFWSVLNANWDIELRNPERELLQISSVGYVRESPFPYGNGAKEKVKLKEVLQFIFDNWKEIKDILDWLNANVFYDCSASSSARFKGLEYIDASVTNGVRKKANYVVVQRGVLLDGRQTKTCLKGVVRLYTKKRIGWKKDRINAVGIGYCTTQLNACENIAWPADGSIYRQAPTLRNFKASQHQVHPYALAIRDDASQFLTYYLYYRDHLFKAVFLFGSGNCM
jgi:hypothetical protein